MIIYIYIYDCSLLMQSMHNEKKSCSFYATMNNRQSCAALPQNLQVVVMKVEEAGLASGLAQRKQDVRS